MKIFWKVLKVVAVLGCIVLAFVFSLAWLLLVALGLFFLFLASG